MVMVIMISSTFYTIFFSQNRKSKHVAMESVFLNFSRNDIRGVLPRGH